MTIALLVVFFICILIVGGLCFRVGLQLGLDSIRPEGSKPKYKTTSLRVRKPRSTVGRPDLDRIKGIKEAKGKEFPDFLMRRKDLT